MQKAHLLSRSIKLDISTGYCREDKKRENSFDLPTNRNREVPSPTDNTHNLNCPNCHCYCHCCYQSSIHLSLAPCWLENFPSKVSISWCLSTLLKSLKMQRYFGKHLQDTRRRTRHYELLSLDSPSYFCAIQSLIQGICGCLKGRSYQTSCPERISSRGIGCSRCQGRRSYGNWWQQGDWCVNPKIIYLPYQPYRHKDQKWPINCACANQDDFLAVMN